MTSIDGITLRETVQHDDHDTAGGTAGGATVAATPYVLFSSDGRIRSGYVGPITIVRDQLSVTPAFADSRPGPDVQFASVLNPDGDGAAYGDGTGGYFGDGTDEFGLPPSKPYMPTTPELTVTFDKEEIPLSKPPRVDFRAPGWPLFADEFPPRVDSGVVWVHFTIYPDATIDYVIDSVKPTGKKFEIEVENALRVSSYKPAIEYGVAISTYYSMIVTIRRNAPSNWVESTRGYIRATIDDPRY